MKCATRDLAATIADQLLDPPQHFLRGTAGESQQENRTRRYPALDQPRHAINQGPRLARTRSRHYQQRTVTMSYRGELLRIEQLRIAQPKFLLVGLGRGHPILEYYYFLGHNLSLARAKAPGSGTSSTGLT